MSGHWSREIVDILQGVYVVAVEHDGVGGIQVDLSVDDTYAGSVTWRFDAVEESRSHLRTLFEWAAARRPLTYLHRAGIVSLIDDLALLTRALYS